MNKATIEFENKDEALLALRAGDYHAALWNLDQTCRDMLEHGDAHYTPEEVLEWVRDFIRESVKFDEAN